MEYRMRVIHILELTTDEMRIISRALRGALKDEELESALGLQERMLATKAKLTRHMTDEAEKHVANILTAHNETLRTEEEA